MFRLPFSFILLLPCCIASVTQQVLADTDIKNEYPLKSSLFNANTPVRVLTEHLPPYQIAKNSKLVGGDNYLRVKSIFEMAQIPVSFEVLPWARAFKEASEKKNTFIFSMVRSPEREHRFVWLYKLNEFNYVFYANIDRQDIHIDSPQDALQYTAVAVRDTYDMEILQEMGFKEGSNLVLLSGADDVWQLVLSGRVDLTIESTLLFTKQRQKSFQIVYETQFNRSMYLAANINTDDILLNKLSEVATAAP